MVHPLPQPVPAGLTPGGQRKAFLLMTMMLSCISLVGNGWSMIAFPVLEGTGFTFSEAVLVASLVGVFQVLGRLGEMASAKHHSALRTAQVSNVLFALSFVLLALAKGVLLGGIIFAAAYGIANGLNTIVKGTLTLALFGSDGYGERLGKVTLLPSVAATLAPVLGGLIVDQSGAYGVIYTFMILGFLAMSLMVMLSRHCGRYAVPRGEAGCDAASRLPSSAARLNRPPFSHPPRSCHAPRSIARHPPFGISPAGFPDRPCGAGFPASPLGDGGGSGADHAAQPGGPRRCTTGARWRGSEASLGRPGWQGAPRLGYEVSPEKLVIPDVPDAFHLNLKTEINPAANTRLMGLYRSNGVYCTQCEADAFRRITYFLDRRM